MTDKHPLLEKRLSGHAHSENSRLTTEETFHAEEMGRLEDLCWKGRSARLEPFIDARKPRMNPPPDHPFVRLTLTPPGPITSQVTVEIRGAVHNPTRSALSLEMRLELPDDATGARASVTVPAGQARRLTARWPAAGAAGPQTFRLHASGGGATWSTARTLEVLPSSTRGSRLLGGAWVSLTCWSEVEGTYWNACLRTFTEEDWRELARGMHRLGMNLIILQHTWHHRAWYGAHYHTMTAENYRQTYAGQAFYPSRLWPGRMEIAARDPVEAILDEADRLGMQVMLGVGLYAHFDYTAGSLAWHQDVLTELWERYGGYASLYGWYISEEMGGGLKPHETRYWDQTETFRAEVLTFFRELRALCDRLAPETLIMLAPSSHHHDEASETWAQLARSCDIFCIQGYQRAPVDGVPVEENIRHMQAICDAAGNHLWMDLEAFGFEHPQKSGPQREGYFRPLPDGTLDWIQVPLVPQSMEALSEDLARFTQFEFICAYQYPGIFCAPDAKKVPGGPAAVRLFEAYRKYRTLSIK